MTDQPIYVSDCQKRLHDVLWRLTERGRNEWEGVPLVPDMEEAARHAATKRLEALGAITVYRKPSKPSRYAVKLPPELIVQRGASRRDVVCDARPIRDTGKFMAAVRRLKLPTYDAPQRPGA